MGSMQGLKGRVGQTGAGFWGVAASAAGLALWWSVAEPRDGVCAERTHPAAAQAAASTASGPDACATGLDWAQGWFNAGAAVVRHG